MLPNQREMRLIPDTVDGFEIKNVPIIEHGRSSPDESAVTIVDIRSDLILFEPMGRRFGLDLAIRSDEPIARAYTVAILVVDVKFQGSYLRKLEVVDLALARRSSLTGVC